MKENEKPTILLQENEYIQLRKKIFPVTLYMKYIVLRFELADSCVEPYTYFRISLKPQLVDMQHMHLHKHEHPHALAYISA